ncbi:MAG TPA: hypothetical protein VKF41_11835 [Bryobacteraceae bacterium]|nr:hypothetical protein [Bryobacteraceae bacterium]
MAQDARNRGISRRSWLLAGLALPLFRARAADDLPPPRFDGDILQPVLPNIHFLAGKPLERLTNGNTVAFVAQVTLFAEDRRTVKFSPIQRFIVSRDIWNATFKVTIPALAPHDRIGLTTAQAESWCLENIVIGASEVPRDKPLWLRCDFQTVPHNDLSRVVGDKGISFLSIIEYLSRKAGSSDPQWSFETQRPFRLQDLPRQIFGRGARLG